MKIGYQVADIMTTTPVMVGMETSLSEAARFMRDSDVNSLIVADGEVLKGIFTDEDIVRKTVAEERSY